MVVAIKSKRMTIEELEQEGTPEGRYELIDGELVEMPGSSSRSSMIGARFVYALLHHVKSEGLGEVFGADGGFVLFPGRDMLRVADAAFVRADRLPDPDYLGFYRLAPDLVVEVISPSDRMSSVLAKVFLWLDAGVRLIWLADPSTRTVTVYTPDRSSHLLREDDELTGGEVLPDFCVKLSEIFIERQRPNNPPA
jgi:Uma2 family endonuclease